MTKTLYKNAKVFTGKNEEFETLDFVVDDKKGNFVEDEKVDQTVDLAGKYVMPGMINAHTHIVADPYGRVTSLGSTATKSPAYTFVALSNLQKILTDGVTYIRDVGSVFEVDIELATLERQGDLFSPGIVASGYPLTMTGGHFSEGSYEVDGVDEARKYARLLLKKGVGNVKLMATGGVSFDGETPHDIQLTEAELRAAVEQAHHKGRTANAHAQGTEGIQNALRAGVDSIEHAVYLDDETIDMFLQRGTYIVPTLTAPWAMIQEADQLPGFMVQKSLELSEAHSQSIGKAAQAGVPIAMGTDSGTAFNNFDQNSSIELELMVNAGVTNLQVLQAATINAAKLLQIDQKAGTIEVGKLADFIVLDEDPLKDIKVMQKEKTVFKKGIEIK